MPLVVTPPTPPQVHVGHGPWQPAVEQTLQQQNTEKESGTECPTLSHRGLTAYLQLFSHGSGSLF